MEHLPASIKSILISFVDPGYYSSIYALFIVLCLAIMFTLAGVRRPREVRVRVMIRALFPRRLYRSPSGRADILFMLANKTIVVSLIGWALLSQGVVHAAASQWLSPGLEYVPALSLPHAATAVLVTVALYLGYEFSYWLDHYLSHRVDFLWQFHAVHHSAESLSPLTNYRIHPVDGVVFANVSAIVNGILLALLDHLVGRDIGALTIGGSNILVLAALVLFSHLQHTHLWISFPGTWGKLFLSPAHHQIHHSADPRHFNKNLGSSLAVWDLIFGTLYVPQRKKEKLVFGVSGIRNPHSFRALIIDPFAAALAPIGQALARRVRTGSGAYSIEISTSVDQTQGRAQQSCDPASALATIGLGPVHRHARTTATAPFPQQ